MFGKQRLEDREFKVIPGYSKFLSQCRLHEILYQKNQNGLENSASAVLTIQDKNLTLIPTIHGGKKVRACCNSRAGQIPGALFAVSLRKHQVQ